MIVKNRLTKEVIEISLHKFKTRFAKELEVAFESYKKTQLSKPFFNTKSLSSIESDFYFDLHWNFNNFGNSVLYIDKI